MTVKQTTEQLFHYYFIIIGEYNIFVISVVIQNEVIMQKKQPSQH